MTTHLSTGAYRRTLGLLGAMWAQDNNAFGWYPLEHAAVRYVRIRLLNRRGYPPQDVMPFLSGRDLGDEMGTA